MKILLIQPPFTIFKTETRKCHPPLGLAYLAAILKDDFEIKILDCLAEGYEKEEIIDKDFLRYGLSFNDIKKEITAFSPDVVAISCLFSSQVENVYNILKLVKDIDNKIITVIGGAHPSAVPEEVLSNKDIDFAIIGEGEVALKRLLETITSKEEFHNIEGLGFRINGRIFINPKVRYEEALDNLPFPYWKNFPLKKYFSINNPHGGQTRKLPFLPVITSRGCPFECTFCSVHNLWGRVYRKRSAENVLSELEYLIQKFGVKEILFEDDNLTLDRQRAEQIFMGMIERQFKLSWSVPNGLAVETLDNELLELMHRSGCYSISLAVESGDENILKDFIKKPVSLSKVRSIIHHAGELGMETVVFFVLGFPGENRAQLKNTLRFAGGLQADNINLFFATPLPGTRLLELCREKGLIRGRLEYSNLKSDQPYCSTGPLSKGELRNIVKQEKLKLYLLSFLRRPRRFFSKIWQRFLKDPAYFLKFGAKYIGIRHA